jgi:hypothetical protein
MYSVRALLNCTVYLPDAVTVAYITVQKFVVLAKHHAWKRLNDYIIRNFGTKGRPADQAIITPMEMLRYCRHRRRDTLGSKNKE